MANLDKQSSGIVNNIAVNARSQRGSIDAAIDMVKSCTKTKHPNCTRINSLVFIPKFAIENLGSFAKRSSGCFIGLDATWQVDRNCYLCPTDHPM